MAQNEQELKKKLQQQVAEDTEDTSVLALDPKYAEDSADLRERIKESGGKLADLDPEARAALESQYEAGKAQRERTFGERRENFLARMFGSGIERSSIAGEVGGKLIGDQAFVEQQAEASHRTNLLAHRQALTEHRLRSMGLEGDTLNAERAAALADIQSRAAQISDARNRRASLLSGIYDRANRVTVANIGANASIRSTEIGAKAQVLSSRISAAASRYSSDQSLKGSLAHAAAQRASAAMGANASIRSAQIGARTARHNARLGFLADQMRDTTNRYGIDQQTARFGQQLSFDQYRFGVEDTRARDFFTRDLAFRERDSQRTASAQAAANRAQRRSSTMGAISGIAGAIGMGLMFSDETLKENIVPIEGALDKVRSLRPVTWDWIAGVNGDRSGGVIAQEIEKVLPEAVSRGGSGYLRVDYNMVLALLISAVQELAEKADS